MTPDGNFKLYKEITSTENGKNTGPYKRYFSLLLIIFKDNWLSKTNIVTMYCEIYNMQKQGRL